MMKMIIEWPCIDLNFSENREKSYSEAAKMYTQAIEFRLTERQKMFAIATGIAAKAGASPLRSRVDIYDYIYDL